MPYPEYIPPERRLGWGNRERKLEYIKNLPFRVPRYDQRAALGLTFAFFSLCAATFYPPMAGAVVVFGVAGYRNLRKWDRINPPPK